MMIEMIYYIVLQRVTDIMTQYKDRVQAQKEKLKQEKETETRITKH